MIPSRTSLWAGVFASAALMAVTLAPAQAAPVQVSIGAYNVKDPDSSGCGPWASRASTIGLNIVNSRLDVVGVQETYETDDRSSLLYFINARAKQKWGVQPYAMTWPPEDSRGYDNRIVYDTRTLSLFKTADKKFAYQAPGDNSRGRHMVWAVFISKVSGRPFLVFNTHLAPNNETAEHRQWGELLAYVKYMRDRYTDLFHATVPVFAVGDFNATKFEKNEQTGGPGPTYYMLPAMMNAGVGDVLGQQYRTYTTRYARVPSGSGNANYNSFNGCKTAINAGAGHNGNSPDYIFASNYLRGANGGSIPYYQVINYPSDHFLITARVYLP